MTTIIHPAGAMAHASRAEERAMLTVTCLAAFLFFNSFGSIAVALPTIQKQFGNSLAEIQWIVLMGVVTISSLSFCFAGRAAFSANGVCTKSVSCSTRSVQEWARCRSHLPACFWRAQ